MPVLFETGIGAFGCAWPRSLTGDVVCFSSQVRYGLEVPLSSCHDSASA